jgi:CHASE2 domain-containing sensor protein
MGKKKDFWDLADSTILGRTKKAELLQIARAEHGQSEVYRSQLELQAEQIKSQGELIASLSSQLNKEDEVHQQVLKDLMQTFEQQQRNHEQELTRLQGEARDWEKLSQNYEQVVLNYQTELDTYRSIIAKLKRLAQMDLKDAIVEFTKWLFPAETDHRSKG